MKYKELFTPAKIGKVELKNRFAMAPMGPLGLGDAEGGWNQRGIDYYTRRAQGGTGLIITGVTFSDCTVETQSMPNCPNSTYNPVQFIRTSREMTERVHAYGAKIFLMMSGGFGRVTIPTNLGEFPPVAPSPIPHRWLDKTCRELTKDEIHSIVESFGKGAANAKRAGFDGVEIHAVHEGYLIDQFAISFFNHRTDEYGGSLENRLRFAREVVEKIHETCGRDFPVALRFSPKSMIKDWREGALPGEEFEEKGRDLDEGIEAAKLLASYGYDALDVDVGSYDSWWWSHPPLYQEKGLYIKYAKMVKNVVDVPVLCAGRMDDPDMATKALNDGACDIVSMGRPLLADPDYVNKLRAGKVDDIRPCIGCHEGCMGRIQQYSMINCAVNPQCARERAFAYNPVCQKKKVVIIGGGIAGCEAARVCAIRGHEPVIYEAGSALGGALYEAGIPSFKDDDRALVTWYKHTLEQLKVEIHFNHCVTADELKGMEYDTLIVATGAKAKTFPLGDAVSVTTAKEALASGAKDVGQKVVVIGGGMVGCELALWLTKDLGKECTIVEGLHKLLAVNAPICSANSEMLERLVPFHGTKVLCKTTAVKTVDGGLVVKNLDTNEEQTIPADTVILAVGFTPDDELYQAMQDAPEIYEIGDCRQFKNVHQAVWDAYEVANHI